MGSSARKWDKSGVVISDKGKSQYMVKLDGSGRLMLRNRSFLKRIVPFLGRQEVISRDMGLQRDHGVTARSRSPMPTGSEHPAQLSTARSSSPMPTGSEHPAQVQVEERDKQPGQEVELEAAQGGVQLGVRCPTERRSQRQVWRPAKYDQ